MNLRKKKRFRGLDLQKGSYLGPSFSHNEIEAFLNRHNYPFTKYETTKERNICLAKELNEWQNIRIFSWKNGIWAPLTGSKINTGRCKKQEYAVCDELENQIQGIIPAICTSRADGGFV